MSSSSLVTASTCPHVTLENSCDGALSTTRLPSVAMSQRHKKARVDMIISLSIFRLYPCNLYTDNFRSRIPSMTTTVEATLTPTTDSFPFQTKTLPLSSNSPKVTLGAQINESGSTPPGRQPASGNGWFAGKNVPNAEGSYVLVSPLSLSASHATLWAENGQVRLLAFQPPKLAPY
jgi:hypothetical protein